MTEVEKVKRPVRRYVVATLGPAKHLVLDTEVLEGAHLECYAIEGTFRELRTARVVARDLEGAAEVAE